MTSWMKWRTFAGLLASCLAAPAEGDNTALTLSDATTSSTSNAPVSMLFPLARSGELAYDAVLSYHTVDGTALAGIDYMATTSSIVVPAGSAGTAVPVTISAHIGDGADQTFQLVVDGATGIGPAPVFANQQTFATGNYPYSSAAADLNGDGKADLIVANYNAGTVPGTVSALLNTTPAGAAVPSFAAQQTFATGKGPSSVAVADVNGDGMPDVIVGNYTDSSVSVMLNTTAPGTTTLTFTTGQTFAAGTNPTRVIAVDVNGDGRPDLVVASENDNTVCVLLNITAPGALTAAFAAQQAFATGATPYSVASADVNGDGRPDLIVPNFNDGTISVLLNTTLPGAATPSFAAQQTFSTETYPDSIAVADLNGDGKPDVIAANYNFGGIPGSVSVLLNTTVPGAATPSFAAQQPVPTANRPTGVSVADVNGDGKVDLLVATSASQTVAVLANITAPGTLTARFAAEQDYAAGTTPISVSPADLNGDGKPDLIVMNAGDNTVAALLNTTPNPAATLNFAAAQPFTTLNHSHSVVAADLNGDGRPDLIIANGNTVASGDNKVSVLLDTTPPGAATPTFTAQQIFAVGGEPYSVIAADLDGDGKRDIVTANYDDANVSVLINTTTPGASTPTFAGQVTFAAGAHPQSVAAADINGDGKPDLITANVSAATVAVLLNTTAPGAAPTFAAPAPFAAGASPYAIASADVNGDGKPDLVVAAYDDVAVAVLLNTTAPGALTPTFAAYQEFPTVAGTHPFAITTADINGDGRPDVIVTNYLYGGSSVSVLLNTTAPGASTPSFDTQHSFATGEYPFSVTAADVDGDGRPDVIVGNYFNSTVSVLPNTTAAGATTPSFAAQQTHNCGLIPYAVTSADINGDGMPDLIVANAAGFSASVLLNTQYQSTFTGSPATGTITHDDIFANGFE